MGIENIGERPITFLVLLQSLFLFSTFDERCTFYDQYLGEALERPDDFPRASVTGIAPSTMANRITWYFDLKGPSMEVDTACSSNLVALDLACQFIPIHKELLRL